jgi:hypothetical protein
MEQDEITVDEITVDEITVKDYGLQNYNNIKTKRKNRKYRGPKYSDDKPKYTNSQKCCSFCRPTFSIRCNNKNEINLIIKNEQSFENVSFENVSDDVFN